MEGGRETCSSSLIPDLLMMREVGKSKISILQVKKRKYHPRQRSIGACKGLTMWPLDGDVQQGMMLIRRRRMVFL